MNNWQPSVSSAQCSTLLSTSRLCHTLAIVLQEDRHALCNGSIMNRARIPYDKNCSNNGDKDQNQRIAQRHSQFTVSPSAQSGKISMFFRYYGRSCLNCKAEECRSCMSLSKKTVRSGDVGQGRCSQ